MLLSNQILKVNNKIGIMGDDNGVWQGVAIATRQTVTNNKQFLDRQTDRHSLLLLLHLVLVTTEQSSADLCLKYSEGVF